MKRIQRGNLKPVKALAAPPFKSNRCLVFVPAVPETLLQLVKATLRGGGDGERQRGRRRRIEGITTPAGTGIKGGGSRWVREEKDSTYSPPRGLNSCCCEPQFT